MLFCFCFLFVVLFRLESQYCICFDLHLVFLLLLLLFFVFVIFIFCYLLILGCLSKTSLQNLEIQKTTKMENAEKMDILTRTMSTSVFTNSVFLC